MAIHHPVFARVYPWLGRVMDGRGMAERRHGLVAGLTGTVVEIGAGNGLNFAHYPPGVTRVLAVEPERHLREQAVAAAGTAPVPVDLVDAVAERLPVDDGGADAVVASLVLCSVRDQQVVLREVQRALKPGGELRFLEHVRSQSPTVARIQHLMDSTVWPRLAGGCHAGRDTAAAIERAGFRVDRLDRFLFPAGDTPLSSYISGTAVLAG